MSIPVKREQAAISTVRYLIWQKQVSMQLSTEVERIWYLSITNILLKEYCQAPCARGTISNSVAMQIKTVMYDL